MGKSLAKSDSSVCAAVIPPGSTMHLSPRSEIVRSGCETRQNEARTMHPRSSSMHMQHTLQPVRLAASVQRTRRSSLETMALHSAPAQRGLGQRRRVLQVEGAGAEGVEHARVQRQHACRTVGFSA